MPASISGIVFNDINQNGLFNPTDPGIPNAFISLLLPDGTCVQTQSNYLANFPSAN